MSEDDLTLVPVFSLSLLAPVPRISLSGPVAGVPLP